MELIGGKLDLDLKENSNLSTIQVNDTEVTIEDGKATIALSNEDEQISMSVIEGSVQISNDKEKVDVKAGEKVQISQASPSGEKAKIPKKELEKLKKMMDKESKASRAKENSELLESIMEADLHKIKKALIKAYDETKIF